MQHVATVQPMRQHLATHKFDTVNKQWMNKACSTRKVGNKFVHNFSRQLDRHRLVRGISNKFKIILKRTLKKQFVVDCILRTGRRNEVSAVASTVMNNRSVSHCLLGYYWLLNTKRVD